MAERGCWECYTHPGEHRGDTRSPTSRQGWTHCLDPLVPLQRWVSIIQSWSGAPRDLPLAFPNPCVPTSSSALQSYWDLRGAGDPAGH